MSEKQLIRLLQAFADRFIGYTPNEQMIINFLRDSVHYQKRDQD